MDPAEPAATAANATPQHDTFPREASPRTRDVIAVAEAAAIAEAAESAEAKAAQAAAAEEAAAIKATAAASAAAAEEVQRMLDENERLLEAANAKYDEGEVRSCAGVREGQGGVLMWHGQIAC